MGYRKVSDVVIKTRLCEECRKVIVGLTDRGLVYWLDVTPISREMEVLYHRAGRPTYLVQPRAGRTAWIDWRNPMNARTPTRGIILVRHPHQAPGKVKVTDPPWVLSVLTKLAPTDEGVLW